MALPVSFEILNDESSIITFVANYLVNIVYEKCIEPHCTHCISKVDQTILNTYAALEQNVLENSIIDHLGEKIASCKVVCDFIYGIKFTFYVVKRFLSSHRNIIAQVLAHTIGMTISTALAHVGIPPILYSIITQAISVAIAGILAKLTPEGAPSLLLPKHAIIVKVDTTSENRVERFQTEENARLRAHPLQPPAQQRSFSRQPSGRPGPQSRSLARTFLARPAPLALQNAQATLVSPIVRGQKPNPYNNYIQTVAQVQESKNRLSYDIINFNV